MTKTFASVIAAVLIVLAGSAPSSAGVLADFAADLKPDSPTAGWSYLWNPKDVPIGSRARYQQLAAVDEAHRRFFDNSVYYATASGGLVSPDPGAYLFFGKEGYTGRMGGHPGRGPYYGDSLEHYAIAAFTLARGGETFITTGELTTANPFGGGKVHLRFFVNDSPVDGFDLWCQGSNGTGLFNLALGNLNAGDVIYAAVGPGTNDGADSFTLNYRIEQTSVPEPSSIVLLSSLGTIGAIAAIRRRRSKQA